MVAKGERDRREGKYWELGISRCNHRIDNEGLLFSTGNYIQYYMINHMEKNMRNICVCIYIIDSLCCTVESNTTQQHFIELHFNKIFLKDKHRNQPQSLPRNENTNNPTEN